MGGLLAFVTLLSSLVTIVTGGMTAVSFMRQRRANLAQPSNRAPQPVAVPSQAQGQPVWQAPAGSPPTRTGAPALPAQSPAQSPTQTLPPAPLAPPPAPWQAPGSAMPYQPAPVPGPGAGPGAGPLQSHAAHTRRRFVKHPVVALGALVAQILFTTWLVIISQQDASNVYIYHYDPVLGPAAYGTFFVAVLLTLGLLVYAAVRAVQLRRWGWLIGSTLGTFAGCFAFSGIALLIFGLWAPITRRGH